MKKLTIYFKSGNKVTADMVLDWKIKYNNDRVTYFSISQKEEGFFKCRNKIIVGSIDLKQIECVVEQSKPSSHTTR